jgi:hypothetical protein
LSLAKVRLLVALVGEDRTETLREAFADAEAELVRHAERLSVRDTASVVNHFAAHADPDGHEADGERMYAQNRFHLAESLDGCGHLDGFLDPESTQIARHALGVIEDRLYRTEHHNRSFLSHPLRRLSCRWSATTREATVEQPLIIDCDECVMQHTSTCDDCIVTFVCSREPDEALVIDADEERALRLLSGGGLMPTLRHQRKHHWPEPADRRIG